MDTYVDEKGREYHLWASGWSLWTGPGDDTTPYDQDGAPIVFETRDACLAHYALPSETEHHATVARHARTLADATSLAERLADGGRVPTPSAMRYLLRSSRDLLSSLAADYRPDEYARRPA